MAKAFTETEKNRIKTALMDKGREYFIRYGLKKTSVDDLVEAVGIAKGSFYRFFDSKEDLFFAIHEDSETTMRSELLAQMEQTVKPREKLRAFLYFSFRMVDKDPLIRAVFGNEGYEKLGGLLSSEEYREHFNHGVEYMCDLMRQWQKEGVVRELDVEAASNLIASTFLTYMQRPAFGDELFDRVSAMQIDCLVEYLVVRRGETDEK